MSNRRNRSGGVRQRIAAAAADRWWWRRPLGMFLALAAISVVVRFSWFPDRPASSNIVWALLFALTMTAVEEYLRRRRRRAA